jgi:ureidoacrylate peracid hydrolase
MRETEILRGRLEYRILGELAAEGGDVIVSKHRFSGFFERDLDSLLEERGITSLVFTGCTTSACVESTLRDSS